MGITAEIDTITPSNISAINQLRDVLWNISTERILIEGNPEYSVYNHGYGGDSIVFDWNVKISWGTENDAIFLLFEVENEEYYHTKYGLWEALADISQRFYITAGYLVVNDDGTLNLVETMLKAGIEQQ
jgi:hypothetical protein